MLKKKYRFNQDLLGTPPGFIMGDIKYAVLHRDNDVAEDGCIISSNDEVAAITKDWELDSKSSGIMSIPSNEVWFLTSDGEYYDPIYVQVEEEYGDTFPDLPTFDREKTQAANTGNGSIYKWVFTEDITRINDNYTGMFTEDDYYSTALPISKVFLPVNYWQNVSELEPYLLLYCNDLESFTIPNSVTSIGDSAFQSCSSLTSITIPNSVTSIGNGAFSGCDALPIENNLRYADTYLVEAVGKTLSTYSIKKGTKWIGYSAFENCTSLTSITIPNSVTSIGDWAFSSCKSLTSVTIPNSVTSIGNYAFRNCTSLTAPVYNAHCFAYMPTSYSGAYTIPEGIKQIAGAAFFSCKSLTSIAIPNSVTSIGSEAFYRCTSLTLVTIGNSVTSIGVSAFYYCSSLTSVTIPNSVTSIGSSVFRNCSSLTSVTIGESVTSIGERTFYDCTSLTSITCEATTPPMLGSNNNLSNVTAVYVPAKSIEAYKTATNWSYYSDIIQAMP